MALIQSRSRQVIVDWAYSNGIIIRRFKSGGYLAFFNERIYRKQVENKFAILDLSLIHIFSCDVVPTTLIP